MADILFYPDINDSLPRKMLFLGDENIGKTTFIKTFCDRMQNYYKCDTVKGSYLVFTQFLFYQPKEGRQIPIQFLDLPAGTTEETRRDQYPAEVKMVVLCFAVDNPVSFNNVLEIWFPEFRQYYPNTTRYYLLGLRKDTREHQNIETVPMERAKQIHQECGFSGIYMEISSEGDIEHVVDSMNRLITEIFYYEQFDYAL